MPSSNIIKRLQAAEDKLNLEQGNSNGEFEKMKAVLEKKVQLYQRYQAEDEITEVERLMISNKREWQMAHLLGLIEHEDMTNKLSELTRRLYTLEEKVTRLEERFG